MNILTVILALNNSEIRNAVLETRNVCFFLSNCAELLGL